MIMEIGIVAGEIWHFLDEKKSATADELTKGLKMASVAAWRRWLSFTRKNKHPY